MICPKCKCYFPSTEKYCSNDGERLMHDVKCNCGAGIIKLQEYCTQCGLKVSNLFKKEITRRSKEELR